MRDPAVHEEVIARVRGGIEAAGFRCEGVIASPVPGAVGGNKEFLAHFVRTEGQQPGLDPDPRDGP